MARRTFWTREFYKPQNAARVAFKNVPGGEVFWSKLPSGKFHAVGFKGSAQKPFFNYTFGKYDSMVKYITEQFTAVSKSMENRARERAVLRQIKPCVAVGDIFTSSWGYEQTNVYFYQVVSLKGTRTAVLRRIAGEREYVGPMQGTMTAVKDAFLERTAPITKRIQVSDKSGSVHFRIESYEYAYKWDGAPRNFTEWH